MFHLGCGFGWPGPTLNPCPLFEPIPSPQVDAEKRTLIKHLPHTLVLHLKRFEFDYETFQRWKVGDCVLGMMGVCCAPPNAFEFDCETLQRRKVDAACRREATQHSGRGCCCNARDIKC